MRIHQVKPLYEHVFELIDQSVQAFSNHRVTPTDEKATAEFQDAVRYLSLLVGFMAVDKHTRSSDEDKLRSYAPIGVLYRGNVEDTRRELDKFFKFLNARGQEIDCGTKNPPAIVQQYERFFANGDEEQWGNMARVLTAYFKQRAMQNHPQTAAA